MFQPNRLNTSDMQGMVWGEPELYGSEQVRVKGKACLQACAIKNSGALKEKHTSAFVVGEKLLSSRVCKMALKGKLEEFDVSEVKECGNAVVHREGHFKYILRLEQKQIRMMRRDKLLSDRQGRCTHY